MRRRSLLKNKPYDARIDYIESTGTQYIDTGILLHDVPNTEYKIDIKFTPYSGGGDSCYVNAMDESTTSYPGTVLRYVTPNGGYVQWAGKDYSTSFTLNKGSVNTTLTLSLSAKSCATAHTVSTTIFAGYDGSGNPWRYSNMRLYYLKITKQGTLVRDFIPVRVGTEGCLYDKVSGKLFHNEGTGSFICGGDVTPIRYLQSDGAQFIITDIVPTLDLDYEIDFSVLQLNWTPIFGCRQTNNGTNYHYDFWAGKIISQGENNWNISYTLGNTWLDVKQNYLQSGVKANIKKIGNTFYFDSTLITTLAPSGFIINVPIYLFKTNFSNTGDEASNSTKYIYRAKFLRNGQPVADFIPVRCGTIGYMYDQVNDVLYGNAGSGSFILGPDMSEDCIKLSYIESTGTQYINIGIVNTVNTEFDLQFKLNDSTGDRKIIGQGFKFGFAHTDNMWRIIDSQWYRTSYATGTDYHRIYTSNGNYIMDVTTIASRPSYKTAGTYPMLLFAASSSNSISPDGNCAIMRLYGCKIYESDTLVRDFIPVRVGNVGYLYDKVSGNLFSNVGTGNFVLGPDITDA